MTGLTAEILTYEGQMDGLRFGRIRFSDGALRRFFHDRLNGTVRLFTYDQGERNLSDEVNAGRLELATAALVERAAA